MCAEWFKFGGLMFYNGNKVFRKEVAKLCRSLTYRDYPQNHLEFVDLSLRDH